MGELRHKTASKFMFTLCACVEVGYAIGDAIIDALVIAGFKVKKIYFFSTAPIASIKSFMPAIRALILNVAGKDI